MPKIPKRSRRSLVVTRTQGECVHAPCANCGGEIFWARGKRCWLHTNNGVPYDRCPVEPHTRPVATPKVRVG